MNKVITFLFLILSAFCMENVQAQLVNTYPDVKNAQPDTYKGAIGKYKITMKLDTPSATSDGEYSVSGVYWYGDGKNGKMTLRGNLTYNDAWERVYKFTEYDPKGVKCGSFVLKEVYNPSTAKTSLKGTMTNKASTTFNVSVEKQ